MLHCSNPQSENDIINFLEDMQCTDSRDVLSKKGANCFTCGKRCHRAKDWITRMSLRQNLNLYTNPKTRHPMCAVRQDTSRLIALRRRTNRLIRTCIRLVD